MKRSELPGLGIDWLWQLRESHPFHRAAVFHDAVYEFRMRGGFADLGDDYTKVLGKKVILEAATLSYFATSKRADLAFLRMCLDEAEQGRGRKVTAYAFYYLCRTWGMWAW